MHKIYGVLDKEIPYPYGKNKAGKGAAQKGAAILSRLLRECHTEKVHLSKEPKWGKGRKLQDIGKRIFQAEE